MPHKKGAGVQKEGSGFHSRPDLILPARHGVRPQAQRPSSRSLTGKLLPGRLKPWATDARLLEGSNVALVFHLSKFHQPLPLALRTYRLAPKQLLHIAACAYQDVHAWSAC